MAGHVIEWLTDSAKRAARVSQLAELKERVGHGGASHRAAEYLLDILDARRPAPLRTHYPFAPRTTKPSAKPREDGRFRIADFGLRIE